MTKEVIMRDIFYHVDCWIICQYRVISVSITSCWLQGASRNGSQSTLNYRSPVGHVGTGPLVAIRLQRVVENHREQKMKRLISCAGRMDRLLRGRLKDLRGGIEGIVVMWRIMAKTNTTDQTVRQLRHRLCQARKVSAERFVLIILRIYEI